MSVYGYERRVPLGCNGAGCDVVVVRGQMFLPLSVLLECPSLPVCLPV